MKLIMTANVSPAGVVPHLPHDYDDDYPHHRIMIIKKSPARVAPHWLLPPSSSLPRLAVLSQLSSSQSGALGIFFENL